MKRHDSSSRGYPHFPVSQYGALLKSARNLDKTALTTIFDLFSPALYKFISRFVPDLELVDRIVADVFVHLIEEFAAGKGPRSNFRCHLYRAAYLLMVERLHAIRPDAPLQLTIQGYQREKSALTKREAEEHEKLRALLAAMNTELNDDQRLVIILRFLENFSVKETAEILGKEISNIKVIQSRGFARLRQTLGMEPDEDPGNLLLA